MGHSKLRVAIIGGGISGLTFAISLNKFAKDVHMCLYEAAHEFAEIGAGIGIWPRGWEIVRSLGLEDDLRAVANVTEGFEYRKSDQVEGFSFSDSVSRMTLSGFHRADFQEVLCKHLPSTCDVHFSKRLSTYTILDSGDIRMQFADGSEATCDLLVGCDGIKSTVRGNLYRHLATRAELEGKEATVREFISKVDPRWSGTICYRTLISSNLLRKEFPGHRALTQPVIYFGKDKHLTVYPVQQGRQVNVAAFVHNYALESSIYNSPCSEKSTTQELLQHFSGWEHEVIKLIGCADKSMLWAINVVASLPTYVEKRVVLVGDAAHAMVPHQGAGAGQAIEDGYILAHILAHKGVTKATLSRALQVYDEMRRPATQMAQARSRLTGLLYSLNVASCENLSVEQSAQGDVPIELLQNIARDIDNNMQWQGEHSLNARCETVRRLLDIALIVPRL